jgi:hypothetical protein
MSTKAKGLPTQQSIAQRARRLPAPVPGVAINIPLLLWPAYQALHGLAVMSPRQVTQLEATGVRKPAGVLWVSGRQQQEAAE